VLATIQRFLLTATGAADTKQFWNCLLWVQNPFSWIFA